MTREEVIMEIKDVANDCNLSFEEAVKECICMFCDGAGIPEESVLAELAGKTTDELVEVYCSMCF